MIMALAICFRYKGREYYKELQIGEEVYFGCHKKKQTSKFIVM